jgi:hypothetical protein
MCTENHVCFGRIHGSQVREGANAGRHTLSLSLPPSHLSTRSTAGIATFYFCEHVGFDRSQGLHHAPQRDGRMYVHVHRGNGTTMVFCYYVTTLIGKEHTCALRTTCVLGGYHGTQCTTN